MSFLRNLFGGPPDIDALKAQRDIDGLLAALHEDRYLDLRVPAAQALGALRAEEAVPALAETLTDTSKASDLRRAAAFALGAIATEAAQAALLAVHHDPKPVIKQAADAARALPGYHLRAFDEPPDILSLHAARDIDGLATLAALMHEPIPRKAALDALAAIGTEAVLPPLLYALGKETAYHSVELHAAGCLVRLPPDLTTPHLLPLLADAPPAHLAQRVQAVLAAYVLARYGDTRAVETLLWAVQDDNTFIRDRAMTALQHGGFVSGIEPLAALAARPSAEVGEHGPGLVNTAVRQKAIRALYEIASSAEEPDGFLLPLRVADDPDEAVAGLVTLRPALAYDPALIDAALRDPDPAIRLGAALTLERDPDAAFFPAAAAGLLSLLADEANAAIRISAARAYVTLLALARADAPDDPPPSAWGDGTGSAEALERAVAVLAQLHTVEKDAALREDFAAALAFLRAGLG